MAEAYIIDAVRSPRSIGKMGKGALSTMHPEHLSAAVLAAIKERNNLNTADVDDVIWAFQAPSDFRAAILGATRRLMQAMISKRAASR